MEAWKRVAPPALAAGMIVVGLLALDWANLDGDLGLTVRLAPLGNELCGPSACVEARGYGAWTMLGYLLLALGGLAAVGLAALTVLRALSVEVRPLDRTLGWLCSTLAAAAGCGMLATGGDLGELGPGGPVTIVGALLGLVSRLGSADGAFAGGRSARPIRSTATVANPAAADPYREAAVPPPSVHRAPRSQPADLDPGPRPATAPPAHPKLVRPSPTAPVAADATRGALRFVVSDATLTADGLIVRFDRGAPRTIPWTSVIEIAARRMPPDPPYEKTAFVDLVLGDGPPARLLPTTRLDLTTLPGGIAPNTKENWRRLVAHAREHHPAIAIEADSADFFAGGRDPVMFPALKKFAEWDRRYG